MNGRIFKVFARAGVAACLSLLFVTASYASGITFEKDAGSGGLADVKFKNSAAVTVDSVVITQDGENGCAKVTRRHKENLAGGTGGPVGEGFRAYLWKGCHYKVKFKTVTACSKGDKDISIRPDDFGQETEVRLKGNCTNGLKTSLSTKD